MAFKVFRYRITKNGVETVVESRRMVNYRMAYADAKAKGYTLKIEYLGCYLWSER